MHFLDVRDHRHCLAEILVGFAGNVGHPDSAFSSLADICPAGITAVADEERENACSTVCPSNHFGPPSGARWTVWPLATRGKSARDGPREEPDRSADARAEDARYAWIHEYMGFTL